MTSTASAGSTLAVEPEQPHPHPEGPKFAGMLDRLNKISVENNHDAYLDVPWDEPGFELWVDAIAEVPSYDPVAETDWYRALTPADRRRYGAYRIASSMKIGMQFENLLQQGLLKLANRQQNGAKSFRYMHHEIIEESQHSMMFQEFVNRTGLPVEGMDRFWRTVGPSLALFSLKVDPTFFFLYVLAGEEPIDHMQRRWLREGVAHPLVERIMRIHVLEEARHISFARNYLLDEVPKMSWVRRQVLAIRAPIVLAIMAPLMIRTPADLRAHLGMPASVAAEAYHSDIGQQLLAASVNKIQKLWDDLGLINPVTRRMWKAFGLWTD